MRCLLLFAAVTISGVVYGQQDNNADELLKRSPKAYLAKPTYPLFRGLQPHSNQSLPDPGLRKAKLIGVTENGNQVYSLPQDNMPCIVPNIQRYDMPNGGKNIVPLEKGPGAIPNPGMRLRIRTKK